MRRSGTAKHTLRFGAVWWGLFLLFGGCADVAGYKSDYKVFTAKEIDALLKDKTVIDSQQTYKRIYYFSPRHTYVYVHADEHGKSVADRGKWRSKESYVEVSGKRYPVGSVCLESKKSGKEECMNVIRNGGKIYFKDLLGRPLTIKEGSAAFAEEIGKVPGRVSLDIVKMFEKVAGKHASFEKQRDKELARIAEEKRRKEQERLERIRREREARKRAEQLRREEIRAQQVTSIGIREEKCYRFKEYGLQEVCLKGLGIKACHWFKDYGLSQICLYGRNENTCIALQDYGLSQVCMKGVGSDGCYSIQNPLSQQSCENFTGSTEFWIMMTYYGYYTY